MAKPLLEARDLRLRAGIPLRYSDIHMFFANVRTTFPALQESTVLGRRFANLERLQSDTYGRNRNRIFGQMNYHNRKSRERAQAVPKGSFQP